MNHQLVHNLKDQQKKKKKTPKDKLEISNNKLSFLDSFNTTHIYIFFKKSHTSEYVRGVLEEIATLIKNKKNSYLSVGVLTNQSINLMKVGQHADFKKT